MNIRKILQKYQNDRSETCWCNKKKEWSRCECYLNFVLCLMLLAVNCVIVLVHSSYILTKVTLSIFYLVLIQLTLFVIVLFTQYRRYKKAIKKTINETSIYKDFAPVDNISADDESIKALKWAVENDRIRNIALTGPYGAGKSSVIESYCKHNNVSNAIKISLASFDGCSWDKIQELQNEKKYDEAQAMLRELEDELEKGILKQFFYKVDAKKIPLSRYRKLHHTTLMKYILGVSVALVVIMTCCYLIAPIEVGTVFDSYFQDKETWKQLGLTLGAFIISIIGISYGIRFVMSKFTIKQISVGDLSAEGGTNQESVFNKNIDEMLYFFECTKYNIVFIEDLDRFNTTTIFVKLKEINNILNSYEVLKKKIVFVYAVKDELFMGKNERTKFFDFIVPVIPVMNSTNSGEIMRNLLGMGVQKEEFREYPLHNISEKFITLVSPYIGDMRVLISIINEFWIYKRTLKENQDVMGLEDEKILALMIYKNLCPKDFSLLEMEEGDVKEVFSQKNKAIENAKKNLEKKKEQLSCLQNDIVKSLSELKLIMLYNMLGEQGFVTKITVKSKSYNFNELMKDTFDFGIFKNESIEIYYLVERTYYGTSSKTVVVSMDKEPFKSLYERYDAQWEMKAKNKEQLLYDYECVDKEIIKLRASTIRRLLENNLAEEILPEKVRQNDLLVFMLRHGYIDENYAEYINYFHPGSITKEELEFILSIRNFRGKIDYGFSIRHASNVVGRLYDYEFEHKETLNCDLLDYLLEDKENELKRNVLMKQIINRSKESLGFIKAYIERGINVEKFIYQLCNNSKYIWVDILNDKQLSTVAKDNILEKIITVCDLEDIINNNSFESQEKNGYIKEYIEQDKDILKKLIKVPLEKMKNVISALGICFSNLDAEGVKKEIIDFIIKGRYYLLNRNMIQTLISFINPEIGEGLFGANYYWLKKVGNKDILDYINSDFEQYVNTFILAEPNNIGESSEDVDEILERLFKDNKEICIKVIEKQILAKWKNIEDCLSKYANSDKLDIWNCLLDEKRVDVNWKNCMTYYNEFGMTNTLEKFVDNNIDELFACNDKSIITDDFMKGILVSNISDINFKKILAIRQVDDLTNILDDISENKLWLLIKQHYLKFTVEQFLKLKSISLNLGLEYIKENKDTFVGVMKQCKLTYADVAEILKINILAPSETILLLDCIDISKIDEGLAKIIKDFKFSIPKEYKEKAWNVLKIPDRKILFLNQLHTFNLDEVAAKFRDLGDEYIDLCIRTRHKFSLKATEFNKKLCTKLQEIGYISSQGEIKNEIQGYVKKKSA